MKYDEIILGSEYSFQNIGNLDEFYHGKVIEKFSFCDRYMEKSEDANNHYGIPTTFFCRSIKIDKGNEEFENFVFSVTRATNEKYDLKELDTSDNPTATLKWWEAEEGVSLEAQRFHLEKIYFYENEEYTYFHVHQ